MDIFKLVGSVFVDVDEANKNLDKTDKKAGGVAGTLGKVGATAAKVGTAVVAGAGVAVAGIMSMAKSSASAADEIDKASIRMGISAESYQELAYAADLAGVETSTLERAAKQLEGTDINFDEAMESIMSLGTAEERAAAAADLFGESVAYQLSPMIEQSTEDFEAAKQQANELGLVMSGDSVKAGAAMNDSLTILTKSVKQVGTDLGVALMPLVQQFSDFLIANMPKVKELINALKPVIDLVFQAASTILSYVMTYLPPVLELIIDVIKKVVSKIQETIPKVVQTLSNMKTKIVNTFNAIKDGVKKPINAILGFINGLVSGITGGINGVIRALNKFQINVPQWVTNLTGVQSFGFNLAELTAPQIPLLAKGGVIDGGSAIVGEDGPELIQSRGSRTTVTPLNDNNNAFAEVNKKLDQLITLLSNGFGVRLDSGAMVGQLAPAIDSALGTMASNAYRRI